MNREKDIKQTHLDFISTLSHELRTPLTSIRGFADTLLTSGDKLDEGQKEKFIKIIKEQSERLIALVENILSATTQQGETEIFVFKPTDIKKTCETTIELIKEQYPLHNIVCSVSENSEKIIVDEDKFGQILLNLIENACKYSPTGSKVEIAAENTSNQAVAIKISDEGIGIKKEDCEKIFEKFSRIDNPMTRKTQGSGIGLFLTKHMTEKMRGSIDVSSSGDGTTFILTFPAANLDSQALEKLEAVKDV